MRWRAAAVEQRVHFVRPAQRGQFASQGLQIRANQVIAARHQRKVAVAAPVAAKGDVNVGCSGSALEALVWRRHRGLRASEIAGPARILSHIVILVRSMTLLPSDEPVGKPTQLAVLTSRGRGAVATIGVRGPRAWEFVDRRFTPLSGRPLTHYPVGRVL